MTRNGEPWRTCIEFWDLDYACVALAVVNTGCFLASDSKEDVGESMTAVSDFCDGSEDR